MGEVVGLVIGIAGLGSLIFAALSWRRNDTTAIVQQQSTLVHDMESLTGQLREALADCEKRVHG